MHKVLSQIPSTAERERWKKGTFYVRTQDENTLSKGLCTRGSRLGRGREAYFCLCPVRMLRNNKRHLKKNVCVHACFMSVSLSEARSPKAEVTGNYESPNLGAGNQPLSPLQEQVLTHDG